MEEHSAEKNVHFLRCAQLSSGTKQIPKTHALNNMQVWLIHLVFNRSLISVLLLVWLDISACFFRGSLVLLGRRIVGFEF